MDKRKALIVEVLKTLLAFASAVIVAYFGYLQVRVETEIPIHATATAEANLVFGVLQTPSSISESSLTPTPLPEKYVPETHPPRIIKVTETREKVAGEELIHKVFSFTDPDGDAYLMVYRLVSTSLEVPPTIQNDPIVAPPEEQKERALVIGTWRCGTKYHNYTVILEARILDRKGNYSEPQPVTFVCP